MLKEFSSAEEFFQNNGYVILDAKEPSLIEEIRDEILKKLQSLIGESDITLENYHEYYQLDDKHFSIQYEMTSFFRSQQYNLKIIESNIDFFRYLLGPDLDIQMQPYLRMARPDKKQDNIGFHRDTYYGTAASELSVFVPFVDVDKNNTLSMYPSSHVMPDDQFETESKPSKDISKGSKKNQIGFLYAPKVIKTDISNHMKPIPLRVGQMLIFMLSTIHGCEVNKSNMTRWSTDIRVKNHFYALNDEMKENYYQSLRRSVVYECSERYSSSPALLSTK